MITTFVTIGVGEHREYADRLAKRVAYQTGLSSVVVGDKEFEKYKPPHPSWMKAYLWELVSKSVDRILYMDADCFTLRPWDYWTQEPFAAVRDAPFSLFGVRRDNDFEFVPYTYFNAGVFMATRKSMAAFDDFKGSIGDHYMPSNYIDQTSFNKAVELNLKRFHRIPLSYNATYFWLLSKRFKTVPHVVHLAGISDPMKSQCLKFLYGGEYNAINKA